MKLSIVHKLSLSFVFIVLLSAGIITSLFYHKSTELLVKHALHDMAGEVRSAGEMLQNMVNTHDEDVLFLAHTPPIQGILETQNISNGKSPDGSSYDQWIERLEKIFEAQLTRKPTYLSIRFIDEHGQEIVHVAYRQGKIIRYRDDKLQNKSSRVYFQEALKLPEGAIYVSEINLNREFGEVVVPYQEVKRSGTPIYDQRNGKLAGVLVITSEIGNNLRSIQNRVAQRKGVQFYITNDRGGYLIHPDASKTYGFDLGKTYRIQQDIPQLASLYLPENRDLQLILMPGPDTGNKVINFTKIPFDPTHPSRFIAVIITQDYASIIAEQSDVLDDVSMWAFLLIIFSVIAGVILAIHITRPIKQMTHIVDDFTHQISSSGHLPVEQKDEIGVLARSFESMMQNVSDYQKELKKLNNSLEQQVLERTQSLKLTEERQRTILESIADAIITINGNGIITSFNLAAEKIFQYKSDEVVGKDVSILLPANERQAHKSYMSRKSFYESNIVNQMRDLEGQRKDGSIFPVELEVTRMRGEVEHGFVGILRDVTERKRIEKMKAEFISTVSHELRTPLTSIHGSIELIKNIISHDMPENISKLLSVADNNSQRLLLLINDILDIQKIESDQINLDIKCIHACPFVKQAIEDNASYAERYGIKYQLSTMDDSLRFLGDKDRLMQVMANLLSNAAKFSAYSNTVEVFVSRHLNDMVRISVVNRGPDIPEDFIGKIFDKFTQLDSSDTRAKGGTGLGLSIARAIVLQHGGTIDVASHEGVTNFYFNLPECHERQ